MTSSAMTLAEKVAIVTGAGSGIGRAIAEEFARRGAAVVAADIDLDAARRTAGASDGIVAAAVDVSAYDSMQALVDETVGRNGSLDIMVNNAGIGAPFQSVIELPVEEYHRTLAVIQHGVFYGIKAAAQAMRDRGGVIINTASVYGELAARNQLPYVTGKGAVVMMTRAAARDLARHNIRVVAIAPGLIETAMSRRDLADPAMWQAVERGHLRRKAGQPEDVARLAAFLAGDEARFLNGHVYFADDGFATFKP